MQANISYEAVDAENAPDHFQLLSGYELTPANIQTTPPATATLWMSPEFTNPDGADADNGKTRDYVIVIEYPNPMENTVVRMNDCPTVHGSRMFRMFIEDTCDEKGYTKQRIEIEDLINDE